MRLRSLTASALDLGPAGITAGSLARPWSICYSIGVNRRRCLFDESQACVRLGMRVVAPPTGSSRR
jgi:hypothetical protein